MNNGRIIANGNSGIEGDGIKLAEGRGEFEEELGETLEVGKGSSNMAWEMFTSDRSGYLSTTLGLVLTTYGMLPIPELLISVALGSMLA